MLRLVIQTGKTKTLALSQQAAVAGLKCLHPEFDYRFFDDAAVDRFVQQEFPEHLEIFENFRFHIQRFDFFRYLAVFRLGGFYFDLDVFFARGVEDLCEHGCVFPFEELTVSRYLRAEGMDWEIGNYAFGAAPRHPFLAAVIENCVRAQRDPQWVEPMMNGIPRWFRPDFYVLNTTGPGLLSRTLAENPNLAKEVTVLFPENVCDERSWHQFGDYGVHLQEGSWRTKGGYIKRRLGNLWEARTRKKLMRESRRLGPTRSLPVHDRLPASSVHPCPSVV
jgi:hypothetical protein